uniref:hypothetical protein n=1 Tax=uncultured Caulobacter sp. TaxID=158749 RepID=UPI0025D0ADBD
RNPFALKFRLQRHMRFPCPLGGDLVRYPTYSDSIINRLPETGTAGTVSGKKPSKQRVLIAQP